MRAERSAQREVVSTLCVELMVDKCRSRTTCTRFPLEYHGKLLDRAFASLVTQESHCFCAAVMTLPVVVWVLFAAGDIA